MLNRKGDGEHPTLIFFFNLGKTFNICYGYDINSRVL